MEDPVDDCSMTAISSPTNVSPADAGAGPSKPHDSTGDWVDQVRRPVPGARRHRLRELRVSRQAQARAARDTADMQAVFEVLENFPVADVLRVHTARNRFVGSQAFRRVWHEQQLPDLSTEGAHALLDLSPESLGHHYAEWFAGWGLDNQFLRNWTIDDTPQYFAYRYAHTHDLLHYVLSYAPYDKSREMEIEAFMFAQTGGLNHLVFIAGFVRNLRRTDPVLLRKIPARLREAYQRGKRAENVMLVDWNELLALPLQDVRRRLRVDDRPILPAIRPITPQPTETPRLAHVVLNVPDLDAGTAFWSNLMGLEESARDDRLGVRFYTDGTDHHTLAMGTSWGRGPLAPMKGLVGDLRLAMAVGSARRRAPRSSEGAKVTVPPLALYRERLRPGLGHIGYRVSSQDELEAWYHHLKKHGVRVDWCVNHGDMIKGIYFTDPAGIRCEIFCDGPVALEKLAARDAGMSVADVAVGDFYNWDLDLDGASAADGVVR